MSGTQGSEKRAEILPSVPSLGFSGSSYSPADSMLTPKQIGVEVGNSMSDVVAGVKGVGFYIDQIGFGAPSTGLTQGMDLRPLGINYFIDTGVECSNGAHAWYYMKGIPEGDALGKTVQKAMKEMGLPPLQGLAPGMLEDAKHALNPEPLLGALLGSGYPKCDEVEKQVGDYYGHIGNEDGSWIADPDTAYYKSDGLQYQKRWVQTGSLSRDEWISTEKTQNPDGSDIPETFVNQFGNYIYPSSIIVVGVLCLLAYGIVKK